MRQRVPLPETQVSPKLKGRTLQGRVAATVLDADDDERHSDRERALSASRFTGHSQPSDRLDDAIRLSVMDHVSDAGKDVERAVRQFLVQAQSLLLIFNNTVSVTSQNGHRA